MNLNIKKNQSIGTFLLLFVTILCLESCVNDNGGGDVVVPDFDFPSTVVFEENLSAYDIFQGNIQDLVPTADFKLLELTSPLFTDYAKKQRLVKVPAGTEMTNNGNDVLDFPDETILVKTFYYYNDDRDTSLGKRVIETRLMIKSAGFWNVATYVWNEAQTDGVLTLDGLDTPINWITSSGENRSTEYHVPDENECIACHQSNNDMIPLGTKLRNLNRDVIRNGTSVNQLSHLQSIAILNQFDVNQVSTMVNYNNPNASLESRARAYMHINCSHCHNPTAWEEPANQDLDLRYEVALNQTGILQEADDINEFITSGEMPFLGTTILDEEGVNLVIDYINTL